MKMTPRERILSALHKNKTDKIPWAAYPLLIPRGHVERKVRNKGCGILAYMPPWKMSMPDVTVAEKKVWDKRARATLIERTYVTPVGEVNEKAQIRVDLSPNKSQWIREYMIKDVSDYSVVKFMIENTSFSADYDSFLEAEKELGEDGIVPASAPPSPMQKMLKELMGVETFSIHAFEHRAEFKELAHLIAEKDDEVYRIIADSPAKLVMGGENVSGDVVSPRLFKEYSLPFYNRQGKLFHEKGKKYSIHMDGRHNCIKNLTKEADIDIVESFTFPEGGGDLPFEEAQNLWKGKAIWANFPASLCHESEEKIKAFLHRLTEKVGVEDGFLLELSEDLPPVLWQRVMLIIADVLG